MFVSTTNESPRPRLRRLRGQPMPRRDNGFVDLAKRWWAKPINVVANATPVKVDVAIQLPQGSVLFGQVLQFVEVKIAAQAHRRQHDDLPVVHALATTLATAMPVNILTDQFQDLLTQFGSLKHVAVPAGSG